MFNFKSRTNNETELRNSVVNAINVMSAEEVLDAVPDNRDIIKGILPKGLTALFSDNVIDKSLLPLDWALKITSGEEWCGHETKKSGVLYMSLDSKLSTLHRRLGLYVGYGKIPEGLDFCMDAVTIDEGLTDSLSKYLDASPSCGLIIIDSIDKVRSKPSSLSRDYEDITSLENFAEERGISIIFTKYIPPKSYLQSSTIPYGDTCIRIKRDENSSIIISSRDWKEDKIYPAEFNITSDTCKWCLK